MAEIKYSQEWWQGRYFDSVHEDTKELNQIKQVINRYHKALINKENVNITADRAIRDIQKILNMYWG